MAKDDDYSFWDTIPPDRWALIVYNINGKPL